MKPATKTEPRRKNILLMMADDLFSYTAHRDAFGFSIQTPNLDRLAAKGARFDHAYAPIAVCGPSRAATFTGLSPFQTGLLDNYSDWKQVLRPEHAWQYRVRNSGYTTSTQGKIFHGYGAQPKQVYDALYDSEPFRYSKEPPAGYKKKRFGGHFGGTGFVGGDDHFYDSQVAASAIEAIKNHDGKKPFYMEAGFHHPHTSFNNPAQFFESVDVDQIMMPQEWDKGWDMLPFPDLFQPGDKEWRNPTEWDDAKVRMWKLTVRNYIASIHFLDHNIGRVLDALEASPWAKDTVVMFFSDHGYHLADRGIWKKFTAYEQAALAPLTIYDPDAKPCVVKDPISLTDIGPTVLEYAGIETPKQFVGQSLVPQIKGKKNPKRCVPTFWYGSASLRVGKRRFILWQDGTSETYDVVKDPWQQKPLKNHPDAAADRDKLLETALHWGLKFVEQGIDTTVPTPFTSVLGDHSHVEQDVVNGIIGIGSIANTGRVPGYHTVWGHPKSDEDTVVLPESARRYLPASRDASRAREFHIVGNNQDNFIDTSLLSWESVRIDAGNGDDFIRCGRTRAIVDAGAGNDTIVGSRKDDLIYGGAGDDKINGGLGDDTIFGGSGNDTLYGDGGDDVIYPGQGNNIVKAGTGHNSVIVTGGKNKIITGFGHDRLEIRRTGRMQEIHGLSEDVRIDLKDWAGLGDIHVNLDGPHVEVTCCRERIVVRATTVDLVVASLETANQRILAEIA